MAIHAETAWEVRAAGAAVNGGGFYDRDPGTSVDYTQQDAAEGTWTNLSSDGAGTAITDDDAGGNFTAAMVGNTIHMAAGGGFSAGFYEIVTFSGVNDVVIDRSAGASASSGAGVVGGAVSEIDDLKDPGWMFTIGNTIWVKAGTYTLTAHLSIQYGGSASLRLSVLGYNSSRGDNPTGNDRPLFAGGANYYVEMGNYQVTKNFRIEGSYGGAILRVDSYSYTQNCSVIQTTASTWVGGIQTWGANAVIIDCEVVNTNGWAIFAENDVGTLVHGCYIHDSKGGIAIAGSGCIVFTICDTCSDYGIRVYVNLGFIMNCVLYNCGVGIDGVTYLNWHVHNCIITGCTTGVQKTTLNTSWYLNYNNWYGNTSDVTNVLKGDQATAVDPLFTNAAAGDFSLQGSSQCIGAGLAIRAGV